MTKIIYAIAFVFASFIATVVTPSTASAGETVYCRTGSTVATFNFWWFNKNPRGKCTAEVTADDLSKVAALALEHPEKRIFLIGITIDTAICASGYAIMPIHRNGDELVAYAWDKGCKGSKPKPRVA